MVLIVLLFLFLIYLVVGCYACDLVLWFGSTLIWFDFVGVVFGVCFGGL